MGIVSEFFCHFESTLMVERYVSLFDIDFIVLGVYMPVIVEVLRGTIPIAMSFMVPVMVMGKVSISSMDVKVTMVVEVARVVRL